MSCSRAGGCGSLSQAPRSPRSSPRWSSSRRPVTARSRPRRVASGPLPSRTRNARALKPPAARVDPELAHWFAVFRRPQRPGDAAPRSGLGLGLEHKKGLVEGGINRKLARQVGLGPLKQLAYVVPGDGYVCLTGAGCADIAFAARGRLVGFSQGCGTGRAGVEIHALLPDYAQKVRMRLRDGSEDPVAVRDNVLVVQHATWPPEVTPTTIVWDGPRGHDATTLGGVGALQCGAAPAINPQIKQLEPLPQASVSRRPGR